MALQKEVNDLSIEEKTDIKGFFFMHQYYEIFRMLPDEDRLSLLDAILKYAFEGQNELDDSSSLSVKLAFKGMEKPLNGSIKMSQARSAAGKKGGAPVGNNNAKTSKNKQSTSKNKQSTSKAQAKTSEIEIEIENERKKKIDKKTYGSVFNVFLSDDEYKRLADDYGESLRDKAIEYLSSYIAEKGYKSNSHNLTIRRWVINAVSSKERREGSELSGNSKHLHESTEDDDRFYSNYTTEELEQKQREFEAEGLW